MAPEDTDVLDTPEDEDQDTTPTTPKGEPDWKVAYEKTQRKLRQKERELETERFRAQNPHIPAEVLAKTDKSVWDALAALVPQTQTEQTPAEGENAQAQAPPAASLTAEQKAIAGFVKSAGGPAAPPTPMKFAEADAKLQSGEITWNEFSALGRQGLIEGIKPS